MGYHARIETKNYASFVTTRCRNSRLWFVNNKKLEEKILAYLAKYQEVYGVIIYAIAIEGNHIHMLLDFPKENRGKFMRDFNSLVAKIVKRYCTNFKGGNLWARRYSQEFVPRHRDDLERQFFYTVLQQVQDGLVQKLSDYPGYNCFHDAVWDRRKQYKLINWTEYHIALRKDPAVAIKNYEETYTLKFTRLPGYESLSHREYARIFTEKLEQRRAKIVEERLKDGKGFMGPELLEAIVPGSYPKTTKKSERYSFRPRVISCCKDRRKECLEFYFSCYRAFKAASLKLRSGILDVVFPAGMYKPPFRPPPLVA